MIAIIPARSGSKGVKNKNIKLLGDKHLIAYSILAAKKIPEVKRIIISEGFEIDGVKCKIGSFSLKEKGWPGGHDIDQAECFQYYNPVIKEYIASRIK